MVRVRRMLCVTLQTSSEDLSIVIDSRTLLAHCIDNLLTLFMLQFNVYHRPYNTIALSLTCNEIKLIDILSSANDASLFYPKLIYSDRT